MITIEATNVELTEGQRQLISRKLTPLARFLVHESQVTIDVVMRELTTEFGGPMFCISVKLESPLHTYMAVSTERHLSRSLTQVRETLRRTISRGASVVNHQAQKEKLGQAFTLSLR